MKKIIKFAILSVIFALCLCFAFLSNNFIGVYANESTDEILEEEVTEEVYTWTCKDGVAYLILKSDFTFELNSETKEIDSAEGTYQVFEGYILIFTQDGDYEVALNKDEMTWSDYFPKTYPNFEDEVVEEETVKDIEVKQLKDWVVVVIGALMSLGVSWGSIATIIKWIKNRLNANKTNIDEVVVKLGENKTEIETLTKVLKKLITDDKQLYDLLSEIKQDFTQFNNSEKEKTKIINTEISKILKKEDEVNE